MMCAFVREHVPILSYINFLSVESIGVDLFLFIKCTAIVTFQVQTAQTMEQNIRMHQK